MKKLFYSLIFTFFFLFVTQSVYSQLNIQAGINSASVKFAIGGLSIETGSTSGIHLGMNYRNRISSKFFFAPGALFSQKGAKIEDGLGDEELKLNYLEVPLMFVYQSDAAKGFFAEGGPYLAYLLSVDDGEGDDEGYRSTDFGIGLGLGYDFGQFIIGIRGSIGISTIAEDEQFLDEDVSVTNNNGMLYGAYKF